MGRPSNKAQRRGEIVIALQKVIAKQGYEKASIQAIAKEAGIGSGLVHYHFSNKQEILVELIHSLSEISAQRYFALKEQTTNAAEKIEAFIDAALAIGEGADQQAVAAWVVIGAEAIRQEEVRTLYQKSVSRQLEELRKLLQSYAEENNITLSQEAIDRLSSMIIASITGAYQLATTVEQITAKNYASTTLKEMVFAVLDKS